MTILPEDRKNSKKGSSIVFPLITGNWDYFRKRLNNLDFNFIYSSCTIFNSKLRGGFWLQEQTNHLGAKGISTDTWLIAAFGFLILCGHFSAALQSLREYNLCF